MNKRRRFKAKRRRRFQRVLGISEHDARKAIRAAHAMLKGVRMVRIFDKAEPNGFIDVRLSDEDKKYVLGIIRTADRTFRIKWNPDNGTTHSG